MKLMFTNYSSFIINSSQLAYRNTVPMMNTSWGFSNSCSDENVNDDRGNRRSVDCEFIVQVKTDSLRSDSNFVEYRIEEDFEATSTILVIYQLLYRSICICITLLTSN
mmetsp:Transcript_121959/g.239488  ORF Transcript_121959/g.239488 Transcript_121959/m.239488 type:complete len:108 (-) Transcript_121959:243-566(-)